jgi:hypothetical protein
MSHVLVDMPKDREFHGHLQDMVGVGKIVRHDFIMNEIDGY